MTRLSAIVWSLFLFLSAACSDDDTLFSKVSVLKSNVDFRNDLAETTELNIFEYDYIYNGAGVAIGDVNNDGLADLYFCGNTVENKLYLNKGDFEFDDITTSSKVAGKGGWKTGVTMADVNADGYLDIYVCYSGLEIYDRSNQLFINNGNNSEGKISFSEKAKEFGLDAPGTYSTQSYFFDYDRDGDLDMFLLNHGVDYHSSFANAIQKKNERHPQFGNRLYRNDDGYFNDVSDMAGISGGWLNYGLSASISDFNGDDFPDLYVGNDFDECDFFYLNNGNGTFRETLKECFPHISKFTMGSDAADFNNDNFPDLITLDMLPEDNYRQKLLKGPDGFDRYDYFLKRGFHHQQMRNMLHLNRGSLKNGLPVFSEVGQLAGVSNTDWSWSSLFADFDNDGRKDLFISNGYLRDFTNLDFQKYDFEEARRTLVAKGKDIKTPEGKQFMFDLINKMSSIKVTNYIFRNSGELSFENMTRQWGIQEENLTNGAAYGDLDNDGDLDLVINNLNDRSILYRNNSEALMKNNFTSIKLVGPSANRNAIGSKVYIKTKSDEQFLESNYSRGFLSSVDHVLHFGLGAENKIQEVKVVWPDGKISIVKNPKANIVLTMDHDAATRDDTAATSMIPFYLDDVSDENIISFTHVEKSFVDYKRERLLLFQLSHQGPAGSVADVNRDGLEDVFLGGASGQRAKLFIQTNNGTFSESQSSPWETDEKCEDVASLFFDADGDTDMDLYVVSGGNEFERGAKEYEDRLYLNNGNGKFLPSTAALPERNGPGSCISASDFDGDGDLDLFIGGYTDPGSYPKSVSSQILLNESTRSEIRFRDITGKVCPGLKNAGVIRDAKWVDYNGDGKNDLIVTGDWMPIRIFKNNGETLDELNGEKGLMGSNGFWNVIAPLDYDKDGDTDFIVGNMGLNSELKASAKEPLKMFSGDFDNDGRIDPVVCNYIDGSYYPLATRDELLSQIPPLRKKFTRYSQFAEVTIDGVLDSAQQNKAEKSKIYELRNCVLENIGNDKFKLLGLPTEAQFAPVQAIVENDFNGDGKEDILMAGNFYSYRVEYGPFDASIGLLMLGDGKGNYSVLPHKASGVYIPGDVRKILSVKTNLGVLLLVLKNDGPLQALRVNSPI
jgi:enediyne biosynthesis protein E4